MKAWTSLLPEALMVLLLALALAVSLLGPSTGSRAVSGPLPLLEAGDPPGRLMAPGAAAVVTAEKVGKVGDYMTLEDVVRAAVALEQGQLAGVAPLTEAERAALREELAATAAARDDLLRVEADLQQTDAALQATTRQIVEALTPEQRAWILANRNQISVGGVEAGYWDTLLRMGPK